MTDLRAIEAEPDLVAVLQFSTTGGPVLAWVNGARRNPLLLVELIKGLRMVATNLETGNTVDANWDQAMLEQILEAGNG